MKATIATWIIKRFLSVNVLGGSSIVYGLLFNSSTAFAAISSPETFHFDATSIVSIISAIASSVGALVLVYKQIVNMIDDHKDRKIDRQIRLMQAQQQLQQQSTRDEVSENVNN